MQTIKDTFDALGLELGGTVSGSSETNTPSGSSLVSIDPSTGETLGLVTQASADDYETVMTAASAAFPSWRMLPAPARGEIVRQLGNAMRELKEPLGRLISIEMGKIEAEGLGEVQEAIDIADFAVGLSRQLYGKTMHSERPQHRMYEQWHPLGVVGIITAFNFPLAVWAWNAMIAAVCGDTMVWKPSEATPLIAVAMQKICDRVLSDAGHAGVMGLTIGERVEVGERMVADPRIPLISATGSCRMGREVGAVVACRFGRSLLELGGNNALVVAEDANLDLALPAVLFGSVGTAGQRCTTTRRLYLHESIKEAFLAKLIPAYRKVKIGNPLEPGTLMGPLISQAAVDQFEQAVVTVTEQGGKILVGGGRPENAGSGFFVEPTIAEVPHDMPLLQQETFAPLLYVIGFETLDQVIGWHNDVPQGLSSAIFTSNQQTAEIFLSHRGSDCGIANVNLGTSGAEIGGAFGGEKDTGGGREAGSDSWQQYMRRQTCTINWGDALPLAQGLEFG